MVAKWATGCTQQSQLSWDIPTKILCVLSRITCQANTWYHIHFSVYIHICRTLFLTYIISCSTYCSLSAIQIHKAHTRHGHVPNRTTTYKEPPKRSTRSASYAFKGPRGPILISFGKGNRAENCKEHPNIQYNIYVVFYSEYCFLKISTWPQVTSMTELKSYATK